MILQRLMQWNPRFTPPNSQQRTMRSLNRLFVVLASPHEVCLILLSDLYAIWLVNVLTVLLRLCPALALHSLNTFQSPGAAAAVVPATAFEFETLIELLSIWPSANLFPLLDTVRLCVLRVPCDQLPLDLLSALAKILATSLESADAGAAVNAMLVVQALCNVTVQWRTTQAARWFQMVCICVKVSLYG